MYYCWPRSTASRFTFTPGSAAFMTSASATWAWLRQGLRAARGTTIQEEQRLIAGVDPRARGQNIMSRPTTSSCVWEQVPSGPVQHGFKASSMDAARAALKAFRADDWALDARLDHAFRGRGLRRRRVAHAAKLPDRGHRT